MARLPPLLALGAACTAAGCLAAACGRAAGAAPAASAPAPRPPAAGGPLPTGLGPLRFPVPGGIVTGAFGWTERAGSPVFRPYLLIAAPSADAAEVAVAAGTVAAVHDDPAALGLYVQVVHAAGWSSLYGGCGAVRVAAGGALAAGAAVCTLPGAGADAVFGLLLDGQPVNPQPYLEPA